MPPGAADDLSERLQVDGPIEPGCLYIERSADRVLPGMLRRGRLCYVLAPRLAGKTSLLQRTLLELVQQGARCAYFDLQRIGSEPETEFWYHDLLSGLIDKLQLAADLAAYVRANESESPAQRFVRFLRTELPVLFGGPVVLYFDGIDAILADRTPPSGLLDSLRVLSAERVQDPSAHRLSFCLAGSAVPAELLADASCTEIRLQDFNCEEAQAFLPALRFCGGDSELLLADVLSFTDGHPAHTQRLCQALLSPEGQAGSESLRVAEAAALLCDDAADPSLRSTRERFALDRDRAQLVPLLALYRRLISGEEVSILREDPLHRELQLGGLAAERTSEEGGAFLRPRSRIFSTVFDLPWATERERALMRSPAFTEALIRWRDGGRAPERLLRGGALDAAQAWAQGRADLSSDELQFLSEGLRAELEAQKSLRTRERAEEAARREREEQTRAEQTRRQQEQLAQQAQEAARRLVRSEEETQPERGARGGWVSSLAIASAALLLGAGGASLVFQQRYNADAARATTKARIADDRAAEAQQARGEAEAAQRAAQVRGQIGSYYRAALEKADEACGYEKEFGQRSRLAKEARTAQWEPEEKAARMECDELLPRADIGSADTKEKEALDALPTNPRRALWRAQCALRIRQEKGDSGSINLMGTYKAIGSAHDRLRAFGIAAEYHEKALAICRTSCTDPSDVKALEAQLRRSRARAEDAGEAPPKPAPAAVPPGDPTPVAPPVPQPPAPVPEVPCATLGAQGPGGAAQLERDAERAEKAGDLAGAVRGARCAVRLREREGGSTMAEARAWDLLAKLHEKRDDTASALESYRRALAIKEKRLAPDHPDLRIAQDVVQRLSGSR